MKHVIKTGWKLFEMRDDGKLFPLFIGKTEETPINEWAMAEIIEHHPGFAHRPGWHLSTTCPDAPWLKSADGTYKSQRGKRFRRVWCEVCYVADVDYTDIVAQLPKKCFTNRLPDGGFYTFRERGGDKVWVIADRIKVVRILSEEERTRILNDMGYDEVAAAKPYIEAIKRRMNAV